MFREVIAAMLDAMLAHVEHNYHTSCYPDNVQWNLVEAMRAYIAMYGEK